MSASSSINGLRVVPARLSYLAIYNPSLGPTDETVSDQIVFYYSQRHEAELERRRCEKHDAKNEANDASVQKVRQDSDAATENDPEQNERLRQVGLAQGMMDFVKNFSNGVPLESIESEKSRVVLKELEPQWWILASIELTQLPATTTANPSTMQRAAGSGKDRGEGHKTPTTDVVEYSSREVAPAQLLLRQMIQANRLFLLHHASSLTELWKRHAGNRHLFCNLLDRYWTRFIWNWDVLLHGNPAVELFDGIKLAGGGELGVGVGEEGWGSGEREVLEGFANRTDGLLDLVVGRYGDAPLPGTPTESPPRKPLPWLGNAESSGNQDGVIFSGIGGISRRSLATISQWMESIFAYGESAYGVGENPASRPREGKKTRRSRAKGAQYVPSRDSERKKRSQHQQRRSPHGPAAELRQKAIENNLNSPRIPAPLVNVVERSLDEAVAKATGGSTSKSPEQEETHRGNKQTADIQEDGTLFGAEKMMKYLSLGYGSTWTLNPKGFNSSPSLDEPSHAPAPQGGHDSPVVQTHPVEDLQQVDPTPEVSDEDETPFVQRLEQSIGRFLIGLSGDLENTEFEEDELDISKPDGIVRPKADSSVPLPPASRTTNRIFLRTLTVEMSSSRFSQLAASSRPLSRNAPSSFKDSEYSARGEGKTSASASIDGSHPNVSHERVQVAVYIHQPFMFVFLFQLRTPNLSMPGFYRSIHHTLGPLQKSLLRSTDPSIWQERMQEAMGSAPGADPAGAEDQRSRLLTQSPLEIYDFVYDPVKLTIRTSIPNIPVLGSLAAEGLQRYHQSDRPITVSGSWYTLGIPLGTFSVSGSSSPTNRAGLVKRDWTRVDALNTYTHVLNIWAATRARGPAFSESQAEREEIERSVKTSRGWWVLWMRIGARKESPDENNDASSAKASQEVISAKSKVREAKEAFLVRRSPQDRTSAARDASGTRGEPRSISSSGRWLLRDHPRSRDASGSGGGLSASSATTNARAVGEGVGVDARKWIERLIRLSM
ncbi:uncharacterized protein A1O9_08043 [Exophiala aquamarina CBS 119918]|uniref:CCZ1/INTU/HSP4 first Longin domain-containing protein n=1 Tax=Exophiala aquamarina CBS 119918 TaxID=1182545 RepID=A0A072P9M0_9EURO|nr:uncharacterized protein A1O9_08043 [Exophiala aquamarina CBS 119918]KEF56462.1 hypothetical protein A1O9_08043 [Exophiala aquamarina CBS 119918]